MSTPPDPSVYDLRVRVLDAEVPSAITIRRWIKNALRSWRMKCLSVMAVAPPAAPPLAQATPAGRREAPRPPAAPGPS